MANLSKSNESHRRLAALNRKKSYSAKSDSEYNRYQIKAGYHSEVAVCQSHIGRLLSKAERKKAFSLEKRCSGNADLRGAFKK